MAIFSTFYDNFFNISFKNLFLDKASYIKICNDQEKSGERSYEKQDNGLRKEQATKQFVEFLGESQ